MLIRVSLSTFVAVLDLAIDAGLGNRSARRILSKVSSSLLAQCRVGEGKGNPACSFPISLTILPKLSYASIGRSSGRELDILRINTGSDHSIQADLTMTIGCGQPGSPDRLVWNGEDTI
jgi:hypothetical protein